MKKYLRLMLSLLMALSVCFGNVMTVHAEGAVTRLTEYEMFANAQMDSVVDAYFNGDSDDLIAATSTFSNSATAQEYIENWNLHSLYVANGSDGVETYPFNLSDDYDYILVNYVPNGNAVAIVPQFDEDGSIAFEVEDAYLLLLLYTPKEVEPEEHDHIWSDKVELVFTEKFGDVCESKIYGRRCTVDGCEEYYYCYEESNHEYVVNETLTDGYGCRTYEKLVCTKCETYAIGNQVSVNHKNVVLIDLEELIDEEEIKYLFGCLKPTGKIPVCEDCGDLVNFYEKDITFVGSHNKNLIEDERVEHYGCVTEYYKELICPDCGVDVNRDMPPVKTVGSHSNVRINDTYTYIDEKGLFVTRQSGFCLTCNEDFNKVIDVKYDENNDTLKEVTVEATKKDTTAPTCALNDTSTREAIIESLIGNGVVYNSGFDVSAIALEVADASKSTDATVKAAITKIDAATKDYVVGQYLELDLTFTNATGDTTALHELVKPITITVDMPATLVNTDTSVTRTYKVARVHNGDVTLLDATYDATTKKLSFATDKFSTYAIVYVDAPVGTPTNPTPAPNTGDGANLATCITMMAVASLAVVATKKKED